MRSLISRGVSVVRPWPILALSTVATVIVMSSAQPASAATGPINDCTSTRAIRGLVNLIVANIVNPVKTYGWKAVAVIILIAVVGAMVGASSSNRHWKMVFWGLALMVVVIPLVGSIMGAHPGKC